MIVIIGMLVVLGSVIGGYLMEHGNLHMLIQPSELVIIFGASIGAFVIASPSEVVSSVIKNLLSIIKAKGQTKEHYLQLLSLLYQLFSKMRKEGILGIDSDIEYPEKSAIFKKYADILSHHEIISYLCDNLKVVAIGGIQPHELDSLMEIEMETHHHHSLLPSHSVARVADGLPGLGIVAAVLGVVLTMSKIDQPPSVLGHSIGAALVGTFLGVLMCYGFVGPLSAKLQHMADEEIIAFKMIKIALASFLGGAQPQMAVEFGRRVIPGKEKPTFAELEKALKKTKES